MQTDNTEQSNKQQRLKLEKLLFRAVGSTLEVSLKPLVHCRYMASLSQFDVITLENNPLN